MADANTAYTIIRKVTRTMLESRSTQPALEAVVKLISEKLKVDVCSIYLLDPESNKLVLKANCGLHTSSQNSVSMGIDEGLTGHAFGSGEVINIADPRHDPRYKHFPGLGEDRLNNFLGISIPPGQSRGRGVLILQSEQKATFDHLVEDLAYTLAAQLGTLIESREQDKKSSTATSTFARPSSGDSVQQVGAQASHLAGSATSHGERSPQSSRLEKDVPSTPTFIRAQTAIGGIASGKVSVLRTHQVWDSIFFTECDDPAKELQFFSAALNLAREESRWLRQRAGEIFLELDAKIFDAHEMMLADEHYLGLIESHIREKMSAAFAVKLATRELCRAFLDSGVPTLQSRAADLKDVGLRILNALGEARDFQKAEEPEEGVVVAAVELLPSDLVYLQTRKILGILCETGGVTSHAAILARSLGIPCFMGVAGLTTYLHNGTPVILDGNSGLIYLHPDIHVQREYARLLTLLEPQDSVPLPSRSLTRSGTEVTLSANVSLLSDLELMVRFGIKDVGLYRSEFFFMIRNQFPDEETQYQVYRRVLEKNGGKKVTFRLLDVGGDKPLRYFDWGKEENPSLGWRSIRMLLSRPDILKPHLRALLRTTQHGDARIVIPMISQLTELRAIQENIAECLLELENEGGVRLKRPPIGIMVEVPSSVLQIHALVRESDFLCIGTNDLIQYLFAIDRGNERVANYYQPYHPVIIRALAQVAAAAGEGGTPVTVCGEMAADPLCLPLLLGLGLTHLSISPASADNLRKAIARVDTQECRQLLAGLLKKATAEEVKEELQAYMGSRESVY